MTKEPKTSGGYTVLDTVDVLDRPDPREDPNKHGNWSSEQDPKIGIPRSDGEAY